MNNLETEKERLRQLEREYYEKFRIKTLYCWGLFNVGLIVTGVLILPIAPPVSVLFFLFGGLMLLAMPISF